MAIRYRKIKLFYLGLMCLFSVAVQADEAKIISVETTSSQAQTVLGSTVIPYKEVTLAAQIPGRVAKISGEVGTAFKKGDVLAQIGEEALIAQRNAVTAQIATAQAVLKNSQAQYSREMISPRSKDIGAMPGFGMPAMMDLYWTRPMVNMVGSNDYNDDMIRYSDLMNSSTNVSKAQASVQRAQAQLKEINTKLRDAKSIAPFDGMILKKMVEVGDTTQPGQPLLKFAYIKYLRLQADVPSGLIGNLSEGMVVPVLINDRTKTMAKIAQIYPIADIARHTVIVKFDLPINTVASSGMYAKIYLPSHKKNKKKIIVIPRTALLTGRSLDSVLIIGKDNKSHLRLVRLGSDQGNGKVEVISGLSANTRIIDNPPSGVSSGWMPK